MTTLPPQEAFPLNPICMFVKEKKMTLDMGAHKRYTAGRQVAQFFFHETGCINSFSQPRDAARRLSYDSALSPFPNLEMQHDKKEC